jgi:Cu2+-exporting ATPase
MDITCQIVHHTNERIRLSLPGIKSQPEKGQLLVALILRLPGILNVRLNTAAESCTITYEAERWTPEKLVVALRGTRRIEAAAVPSCVPLASPKTFPFQRCRVVHAVRGRVRFHLPIITNNDDLAAALKHFLEQQAGVRQVRLNRLAASVIIQYEPVTWSWQALQTLIRAYEPNTEELAMVRQVVAIAVPHAKEIEKQTRPSTEIMLAASALALSLVGGPAAPLAALPLLFSTRSIFQRAYHSLRYERQLTVESLDAAAITVLALQGMYWQVALLNLMLSGGDLIRTMTQEKARQELTDVLDCMTDTAWVKKDGQMVSIAAAELTVGDTVYIFPGERLPADGLVLGGRALVDQHMLTGESMPVAKQKGEMVYAATVLREGELQLQVTHTGDETQVARIVQLVESAPLFDTRAQDYARRWANRLVPYSFLGAGVLALLGNFHAAAALLVIDYAAGFKVAAPTTIMSAMTKAARQGIFIRGGRHLEKLAEVNALVFDKTGTLTLGSPELVEIIALGQGWREDEVLTYAAAAEQCLAHPVAVAVTRTAVARALPIFPRDSFTYEIGQGVAARVNGLCVLAGSRRFLVAQGVPFPQQAECCLEQIEARAASPLCLAVEGVLVGVLGLADPIRPESAAVIQALRQRGVEKIVMLTGDRARVAAAVARHLDIEDYVAEVFPADKLTAVQALQAQGYTVAVVGDGINDSPSLAQADVGIAVNGGTALAQETADLLILQGDLRKVVEAIDISCEGMALVRQNWDIVRIPNTIGLGLAFTGLIGPLAASLISDGATLVAGSNALRPLWNSQKRQKE